MKEEPIVFFRHFTGRCLLTASLMRRRMSMYISLLVVLQFLSIIPANSGNVCKLLRIKVGLYILRTSTIENWVLLLLGL